MRAHSGRLPAALSVFTLTAAAVTGLAAPAVAGTMTPAIGVHPQYQLAGQVAADPAATVFT
ncbi:MAG TPA: hypothetical protein VJX66_18390, partial [Amycolatopsis sp.]|nr:hypothetical protein [Amycolatopsis sp.]